MKTLGRFLAAAVVFILPGSAAADVPQLINYQGRLAVGSVNFNGSGQFKFALVNTTGSATYWSNDGTSAAGSQPAGAVTLAVTNGLYSVLLGDAALPNMSAIPVNVFANTDVRLRIWFNDGTHGVQLLTPDQRIAAVGYAMMAGNSATVADGAVTSAKIANGAVGAPQLATGSVGAAQLAQGAISASLQSGGQDAVAGLRQALLLPTTPNNPQYVFATISNSTQALRIGLSDDAYAWRLLRNAGGSTDLYHASGGRDLRDPSLAKIGDKWWVTYTVGDYGANNIPPTSGNVDGGSSPVFGIASSTDLISWTHIADVPVPNYVAGNSMQVWGPEWYVDRNGKPYITCPSANFISGVAKVYIFEPVTAAMTSWVATGTMEVPGTSPHFIEQWIVEIPEGGVWYMYMRNTNQALTGVYRSTEGPFRGYKMYHPSLPQPGSGGPNPVRWDTYGMEGVNLIPLGNGHWKILAVDSVTDSGGYLVCESFDDLATATPLTLLANDDPAHTPSGLNHGTAVRIATNTGSEYEPSASTNWRPRVDGNAWDIVQGGLAASMTGAAQPTPYVPWQVGPLLVSKTPSPNAGNTVYWYYTATGYELTCLPAGGPGTQAVGAWFASYGSNPASAGPTAYPAASRTSQVVRVKLPAAANRAGRRYYLTGTNISSESITSLSGDVQLRFNGASNSLECVVVTSSSPTFAAIQTTSGPIAAPATGTFTAYSMGDSTREMMIRRVAQGNSATIEIAAYSETPVFKTVLSVTGGKNTLMPAICADGTGTGSPAAGGTNGLSVIEIWDAVKF